MNILFYFLAAVIATALASMLTAWIAGFNHPRRSARFAALLAFAFHAPLGFLNGMGSGDRLALANSVAEGTHKGSITRRADGAHTSRHLLVKVGSDADHIALAGTADIPIGVCPDQPAAAEDPVEVRLLGGAEGSRIGTASAAISAGDYVVSAASGQFRTLPGTTGTYYIVGRALTAASGANDLFEFDPCVPVQRVLP